MGIKTWDELQDCLRRLLRGQKDFRVEVSKLKTMFRNFFRAELSETVFGHQNLSKLLRDPQIGPEFQLEIVNNNRFELLWVNELSDQRHPQTVKPPPGLALAEEESDVDQD